MFLTFLGPPTQLFDDVILEWSLTYYVMPGHHLCTFPIMSNKNNTRFINGDTFNNWSSNPKKGAKLYKNRKKNPSNREPKHFTKDRKIC